MAARCGSRAGLYDGDWLMDDRQGSCTDGAGGIATLEDGGILDAAGDGVEADAPWRTNH